jgi:hypothetical protein
MAPKVSVNIRVSEAQSDSLTFKNKRRRKVQAAESYHRTPAIVSTLEAGTTDNSPKHRWKLNGSGKESTSDRRCMTKARQSSKHNNSPHDVGRKVDKNRQRQREDVHHASFHDVSAGEPQRRDSVNCRKLFASTTASGVRKLLPIFILVNMLPFLYAGESPSRNQILITVMHVSSKI